MIDKQSPEGGENLISRLASSLPRRPLPFSDKEKIWARVHSYIMAARLQTKAEERLPVWKYLVLPRTLIRVGATVMVVIMALTMVGSVASAQPGETLYQVKIAAEQVEKVVAVSDTARVKVGIRHAKRRLAEVKILVEEKKDTKIVEETLEALKTTTEELVEVIAISDIKPELTSEAAEVAVEQERVLTNVETAAESNVKEAVQNAIAQAKESINKLASEGKTSDVKGVATPSTDSSTTTAKTAVKIKKVKRDPALKDTPVETDTQLGDVITVDENNEPEVVSETNNQ